MKTTGFGSARDLYARGTHPRIVFGPEDIPVLRERASRGLGARALAGLVRRCERWLDPAHAAELDAERYPADGSGHGALQPLSFAWMLTGERRFLDKALEVIRCSMATGKLARHPHSTEVAGGAFPLAYDILYDALPEADRAAMRLFITARVREQRANWLNHPERWVWLLGTNPTLVSLLAYPYWAAAADGDPDSADDLRRVAELVRRSLHLGVDRSGCIGEGHNYGLHDAVRWTLPVEILCRAGIADLWSEEERLAAMLRFWAYIVLPGRREVNAIGDAIQSYGRTPLWSHLLGARRLDDPLLQWLWEHLGGRGELEGAGAAPERFEACHELAILWDRDDAVARDPAAAGLAPACASGEYGVNVMRSGWAGDSLYVSLLASGRSPGCVIHQHMDGGHMSLFALGEAFSIDTGYGDIDGAHHSLMRPHDPAAAGQRLAFGQVWAGGRTEAFAAGRSADYCRVNVSWQWQCLWSYRHALVVRGPGTEPYVVILDNANRCNDWSTYEWLINSSPGNRVEVDSPGLRAVVHGRVHRMDVVLALPRAADYPKSHQLELSADELDTESLDHVKPGLRLGIGRRPRLRGLISGYNGILLSAWVPRRAQAPAMGVSRIVGPMQTGLVLDLGGGVTDTIVASPIDRGISIGGLTGEATLAVLRQDGSGKPVWWAAADAYCLAADGAQLLRRRSQPLDLAEHA